MKRVSHIPRTLKYLRGHGIFCDQCDRRVHRMVTRDLFGAFDILAMQPERESIGFSPPTRARIIGIQVTSMAHRMEHIRTLQKREVFGPMRTWHRAGGCIELWCWEKRISSGRWHLEITQMQPHIIANGYRLVRKANVSLLGWEDRT